jgi:hypothetical protein
VSGLMPGSERQSQKVTVLRLAVSEAETVRLRSLRERTGPAEVVELEGVGAR